VITTLQRLLVRHRRWVFALLILVVVVPFVFTVGASRGIAFGGGRRRFFDVDLRSAAAVDRLRRETLLGMYLAGVRDVPLDSAMLARCAWHWMVKQLRVPRPSLHLVESHARRLPIFQENGAFSEERYADFLKAIRNDDPASEAFVAEVLAQDWQIGQVAGILAAADFTLPVEAELQHRHLGTNWTVTAARLRGEKFPQRVELAADAARNHWENNRAAYYTEETVRLVHVFFPAADGENSSPDGQRAIAAANEFLYRFYGSGIAPDSAELRKMAEELGGEVRTIGPFAADAPPENCPLPADALRAAFFGGEDAIFTDPILTDAGVHVPLLAERTPQRELDWEEARPTVETQLRKRERERLFGEVAWNLRGKLEAKLRDGNPFSAAAGSCGFAVEAPQCFSAGDLRTMRPEQVAAILPLGQGDLSNFVADGDDLVLFHIDGKEAPAADGDAVQRLAERNRHTTGQLVIRQLIGELMAEQERRK
jgi:hypothetical protein